MANADDIFEHAVSVVLAHEGVYSNDQDDPGGETKFGISKRSYPHLNIAALTVGQAKSIYKRDFWDPYPYKDIKDINVAAKVFDLAVNMGAKKAHILVQRALRATGDPVGEDGILGPRTLAAINKADPRNLLVALKSEAAGNYRIIAAISTTKEKFVTGWLNRAYA
jgi:lysozyme family protein